MTRKRMMNTIEAFFKEHLRWCNRQQREKNQRQEIRVSPTERHGYLALTQQESKGTQSKWALGRIQGLPLFDWSGWAKLEFDISKSDVGYNVAIVTNDSLPRS